MNLTIQTLKRLLKGVPEFKADFLNRFVTQHQVSSVIEFGSGDGSQLKLARYPKYIGVDVSSRAIQMCRTVFSDDASKLFLHSSAFVPGTCADLAVSLDVIYHLVEDNVFETYMRQLFASAERFVIVYSSNVNRIASSKHILHRQFTEWVELNEPGWILHSIVKNVFPYDATDEEHTSFADFYVFVPCHAPSISALPIS
jgi:cyclopropane fatty-acyl-phospholipid synthase-like methyltransferase